jgi:UDP-glucose 4-epimerase
VRILVTGGAGYIGSHAARLFAKRGHEVWVLDNLSCGHAAAEPAGRLIVADLDDVPTVETAIREHRIDSVVHFAAFTSVAESVQAPAKYYRNNFVNTLNLLEAMGNCGVTRVVVSRLCLTNQNHLVVALKLYEETRIDGRTVGAPRSLFPGASPQAGRAMEGSSPDAQRHLLAA